MYCTTHHPTLKKHKPDLNNGQQAKQRNCFSVILRWCKSENISGVFSWIYLDWSHGMPRQHLSVFFGIIIGLSLTIEDLTRGETVIWTYTPHILHVAHWCFLFLVGRVWISCLLKRGTMYFISLLEY